MNKGTTDISKKVSVRRQWGKGKSTSQKKEGNFITSQEEKDTEWRGEAELRQTCS